MCSFLTYIHTNTHSQTELESPKDQQDKAKAGLAKAFGSANTLSTVSSFSGGTASNVNR